jgi:hypothetical protein
MDKLSLARELEFMFTDEVQQDETMSKLCSKRHQRLAKLNQAPSLPYFDQQLLTSPIPRPTACRKDRRFPVQPRWINTSLPPRPFLF